MEKRATPEHLSGPKESSIRVLKDLWAGEGGELERAEEMKACTN